MGQKRKTDIISCEEAQTLAGLFSIRIKRNPQAIAYRQFDVESGKWREYNWQEMGMRVARWKRALMRENLEPGDRVAILLSNSIEWVCFDQAALAVGLVVVPLYPFDAPDNIAYILEDSGTRLLLVGTQKRWETLASRCKDAGGLAKILCLEHSSADGSEGRALQGVDEWLRETDEHASNQEDGGNSGSKGRYHPSDPHALATLVYTSGTTGKPKGVMLSHFNVLWDAEATLQAISGYPDDVYLSLLPLSHMLERTVGYYVPLMAGSSVAYARSLKDLPEDLKSVRPGIFVAVPQVYAGIRNKMNQQVQERGRIARLLFDWTVALGWEHFTAVQGQGKERLWQRVAWPILRQLVADKVLAAFGGRIRLAVSGGGPLAMDVSKHFIGLGLPLLQGYGLTEASPVLTANRMHDIVPESTGSALAGVELRISEQDELLARSPGVMLGYWNRPEETRAAIDAEGWLHTGDQARISDNHVFISGRIKEILVTSSGEKVPPADLEMAIVQEPLFDQVMVVGEGRSYLAALVVVDKGEWQNLASTLGLKADEPQSLAHSTARAAALKRIKATLRGFPKYARIRAVHLSQEPWKVEDGLLTPTLKLKRLEIEKCFASQITELYEKG
ncbi:long-chain acyl-CoA synthetase [Nitrosospira multiformis]|uniref:Long-chain acyl-CoA synthetase n=1 Tax=Nitrosospira multiformis TaxID=1231 RepID=A0A2T5I6S7_9PROT|nr:long-chain fatty acid--CoA ligase [Nitrosospira multiformis]PTQ79541.1 long-chain acyl-CoA synthetase [Nitrosospira multiformis]